MKILGEDPKKRSPLFLENIREYKSIQDGATTSFTCEVGGFPITEVKITGPNYL